ncbi:MAG: N-succinylarginine dihydrolase [Planctomycetota bacterium]
MSTREWNFDGLIGPTHNYAGLGPGNIASHQNLGRVSHPRQAALQGLKKMSTLHRLGVPQAVLPPQPRPNVALLRSFGFRGDDVQVVAAAQRECPRLIAAAMSASCMWTANAATVCPSADAADGKVHITPANLVAGLHRHAEVAATAQVLRQVFPDEIHFTHHDPLPASWQTGDEGAANHSRFGEHDDSPGVQLFVHGVDSETNAESGASGRSFRPRQTQLASRAVARLHTLSPDRVVYARQHPDAVNAGVFHNDVIAVAHRQTLFCHQRAFSDREKVYSDLRNVSDGQIRIVDVSEADLTLDQAVQTYLFNSQVVTDAKDRTVLIAPRICETTDASRNVIASWIDAAAIDAVEYVDVDESLDNGGGPACLRLRVLLTEAQEQAIAPGFIFDERLETELESWIQSHYRDTLAPADLADPSLAAEVGRAMESLSRILGLDLC